MPKDGKPAHRRTALKLLLLEGRRDRTAWALR
jgi:hypothetical protein